MKSDYESDHYDNLKQGKRFMKLNLSYAILFCLKGLSELIIL